MVTVTLGWQLLSASAPPASAAEGGTGTGTHLRGHQAAVPNTPASSQHTVSAQTAAGATDNIIPRHGGAVALFLQVGNADIWPDMLQCATNVALAVEPSSRLDVHISFVQEFLPSTTVRQSIERSSKALVGVDDVHVIIVENAGADVGQFIHQLKANTERYGAILKLHSKTDPVWRQRAIQSLCGTPHHVRSILNNLQHNAKVDMVAPLGTTFGPRTPVKRLFPHIYNKYFTTVEEPTAAFDPATVERMQRLHDLIEPGHNPVAYEDNVIVAGTMFWVRYAALRPEALVAALPALSSSMTRGYLENGGAEHALERLLPTAIQARGKQIAEVSPAPKVMAMYFPQFTRIPENDKFWGEGFTEWTLLKPFEAEGIRKPLPTSEGGLGYYDLLSYETRRRQAELARAAGVHGFAFYHYWFSGSAAPPHHKVMYQVIEAMLLDGQPDLPFMLSWANEPWVRRWTGGGEGTEAPDSTLLSQEYGDEDEWRAHLRYLSRFFLHPRYVRVQGKPVFAIYRIGHVGAERLAPMVRLWQQMARDEFNLPGLHIVNTVGNFYLTDPTTATLEALPEVDASFHFWPQLLGGGFTPESTTASVADLPLQAPLQYWGAFTGFDRRPRAADASPILRAPAQFYEGLMCSFTRMAENPSRNIDQNLFFVTAWNEWNEQALLEPDDTARFGYLQALQHAVESCPWRSPWNSQAVTPLRPGCR